MTRTVVLAGGSPHAHDFAATGQTIAALATELDHEVVVTGDPDHAASMLGPTTDALVVDGLWWRMHGSAYDEWRDRYAYSAPPHTRTAVTEFVREGGGLLGLHTSSISFDDWPEWGDILGGAWQWGISWHPPLGPVTALVAGEHPVVAGLPPTIELRDEVYGDLELRAGIDVLAVARREPDDSDQPVVWAHRFGNGRVVYDGFGHDTTSINDVHHRRLLLQALSWIVRGGG